MKRRKIWTCLFLFVFPFLFIACSASEPSDQTQLRLVEVTHSPFYAPQYVALRKGFFAKHGLKVDITNGNGGDKTMTALLADQADIVLVGAEAGIYVTARSTSEPIVAFAQLTQTDGSFLVSRHPISSFNWSMLKGKTLLGQRRGGAPQMVSEYVQRQHGLQPHVDVKIIQNVEYQNLGNAFIAGTGDFAQLFEPIASKIEQEGKGYIVASFGKDSGILPYTCYLTKKSFLQQNPELIKRFSRAIYEGQKWVETHSAHEIAQVIQNDFPDMDPQLLTRVIQRFKDQNSYATDLMIDEEEYLRFIEIMEQAGELPKAVPYQQFVHVEFSQEVMNHQ